MSEFRALCIEGNRDMIDNMYMLKHRHIALSIYSLMLSPQPEIFRLDNLSFISYMINKEELFSVLTSMNMRYIFKNSSVEEIMRYLDSYRLIRDCIKHNPMNIIMDRLDDNEMIELCCELSKDNKEWLHIASLNVNDDIKLQLYDKYKDVFVLPRDPNIIASCKNLELFKIYVNAVNNNKTRKEIYDRILVSSDDEKLLDIALNYNTIDNNEYGRINHVEFIPTMNINMLKYVYNIRTPKKNIFVETIDRVLLYDRLDLYELLLQLAPKDIDIWLILQRNPSVNILSIYMKYFTLTPWQWSYLDENISIRDIKILREKDKMFDTCCIL